MKTIKLTQGQVTLVDDDVYKWASKVKWYAHKGGKSFYAQCHDSRDHCKVLHLHQEIMRPDEGLEVDHRDGDGLNNRRNNLRTGTHRQNMLNQRLRAHKTSKFRGVARKRTKWTAQIKLPEKQLYLGTFLSEEAAARVYDAAAQKYFGEFAQLNFPLIKSI